MPQASVKASGKQVVVSVVCGQRQLAHYVWRLVLAAMNEDDRDADIVLSLVHSAGDVALGGS
jgi:hypothetical protein